MASSGFPGLGYIPSLERLGRSLLRLAAALSWLGSLVLAIMGLATGGADFFRFAVGPTVGAVGFTLLILIGHESVSSAMALAVLTIIVSFEINGEPGTRVAALIPLFVAGSVWAMVLPTRSVRWFIPLFAVLMGVASFRWASEDSELIVETVALVISFAVGSLVIASARNTTNFLLRKYRRLFDSLPISVFEQNWQQPQRELAELPVSTAEELRNHLESRPELVRRLIGSVRVDAANPAAYKMLDLSPGTHFESLSPQWVNDKTLPHFIDQLVTLWNGEPRFEGELNTTTYSGRELATLVTWDRSLNGSDNPDAQSVVVAALDITELRKAESRLRHLLVEKDRFLVSVTHELRTPLSVVVGLSHELADHHVDDPELHELLILLQDQADAVGAVIENLVLATRIESGDLIVDQAVVDVTKMVHTALGKTKTGKIQIDVSDQLTALGDNGRIEQAIRNLIWNSTHYGNGSTKVIGRSLDSFVRLEVRDEGSPLDEDAIKRIFRSDNPLLNSQGVTSCFGLGLAVTRRLAELMGGQLTYRRALKENVYRLHIPNAGIVAPR